MKLTIKEIAEMAKVSKGTVSKALNGQPGVGPGTRERIMKLIRSLNYEPSSTAQALAFKKTGNIGVIIPHEAGFSLSGAYWSTMITSIAQRAMQFEYNLLLLTSKREGDIESAYSKALKKRSVDGLIIGSELLDKKSITALLVHEMPFVLIGRNPELSHYYVDVDNERGAYEMTCHIAEQGFTRIGLLTGPAEYHYSRERISGFRTALRERGLPDGFIAHSGYISEDTSRQTRSLIERNRLDALFVGAGGDFMLDALRACSELGLEPPSFGLAVFDDYAFLDYMKPGITAVRQPIWELGTAAVRMLFETFQTGRPEQEQIVFPTSLVIRESCGERFAG
jgi:LacI family transcriptional regulator